MSFELKSKTSLRSFNSLLKSLCLSFDTCILSYSKRLGFLLLQNLSDLYKHNTEKISILIRLKLDFFSVVFPPNLSDGNLLVEVPIQAIYRHINSLKSKLSSLILEFPALMNQQPFSQYQAGDLELNLRHICGEGEKSSIFHKKFHVSVVTPAESQRHSEESLQRDIQFLDSMTNWKRTLEFQTDNPVNLTEFRKFTLDFIMLPDRVLIKDATQNADQLEFSISLPKQRFTSYSNDVCEKDFEGRNKLTMDANKLINYMQLCKEVNRKTIILVSKKNQMLEGDPIHRILLQASIDYAECYQVFSGRLLQAIPGEVSENIAINFEEAGIDSDFKNEEEEEEEKVGGQNFGSESGEELDPDELDKELNIMGINNLGNLGDNNSKALQNKEGNSKMSQGKDKIMFESKNDRGKLTHDNEEQGHIIFEKKGQNEMNLNQKEANKMLMDNKSYAMHNDSAMSYFNFLHGQPSDKMSSWDGREEFSMKPEKKKEAEGSGIEEWGMMKGGIKKIKIGDKNEDNKKMMMTLDFMNKKSSENLEKDPNLLNKHRNFFN